LLNEAKTVAALAKVRQMDWSFAEDSFAKMAAAIQRSGVKEMDVRGLYHAMPVLMRTGEPFVFAHGLDAVDGKDGEIKFLFESRPAEAQWRADESSQIDFRKRNEINNVTAGQLLAEVVPPVPAQQGLTVFGLPIKAKEGRTVRFRAGKNVRLSSDEKQAFAEIDGSVKLVKGRISVDFVKRVDGNVDFKSGNIDFKGDVIVTGDVNETFNVVAGGSIQVAGMVDRAALKAGGDISVEGGIYGKEGVLVEAEGDLNIGFAENAILRAGGNIYVRGALVNCDTHAEGRLYLRAVGKALIGGTTVAICGVDANCLGNPRIPTKTIIEFGLRPDLIQKMRQLNVEFEQANEQRRYEIRDEMETLREEYERQMKARIVTRRSVYPGVVLKTGKISYDVRSEISSIVYYKVEGKNEISMRAYAAKKPGEGDED
jgi:uncharacterized protein (DUF342 family)